MTETSVSQSVASNDGRVIIFDTTLRDGEQSPGCSMNVEEKIRVAEVLEGMGVDVIEAGFPIASEGDFRAVNEIAKRVKRSVVCGLAPPPRATSTGPARRSSPRNASASTPSSAPRRCTASTSSSSMPSRSTSA